MRTLILAFALLATAMSSAENRLLRGASSQEARKLETFCELVPTADMWVELVAHITDEATARAEYQACLDALNGGGNDDDDNATRTDEQVVTRPGCYEPSSVTSWKNGVHAANFTCTSNVECVDYDGMCYYYYDASSCVDDFQKKPECDSIIAVPDIV